MGMIAGCFWKTLCWAWSRYLELRCYIVCYSLWCSSFRWWKHSKPLQENKGICTKCFLKLVMCEIEIIMLVTFWYTLEWTIHSSKPFVFWSSRFDSKNAGGGPYEEDNYSWDTTTSLVQSLSSSLFSCHPTQCKGTSKKGNCYLKLSNEIRLDLIPD